MRSGATAAVTQATTAAQGPDGGDGTLGAFLADLLPASVQVPGWKWIVAAAIVGLGVWLSKLIVRLVGRRIARRFRRQSVAQTVLRGVRLTTILLSGVLALNVLGLEVGNIVLSVTVFSAVLGVILAPLVGNLIGGLFILADQPYEIDDMIELDDGTRGFVEDITIRYTKVITLDNTFLVLPNSEMRQRDVTNYSAEDERTRLALSLLVTYESDIPAARSLLERAAMNAEGVIEGGPDIRIGSARYPAKPTCYIDEYADHGVLLTLRYWAERPYKLLTTRSHVQTHLWELLEASDADVEIAYPHQHLMFDETSGQARVAVERAGPASPPADETEPGGANRGAVGGGRQDDSD